MTDLFERKSSTEVESLLDTYLSDDESAETRSSETTKYASTSTSEAPSSVDAAFAELGIG